MGRLSYRKNMHVWKKDRFRVWIGTDFLTEKVDKDFSWNLIKVVILLYGISHNKWNYKKKYRETARLEFFLKLSPNFIKNLLISSWTH